MFQKFFTDTIENKFIKSLLKNTAIPIYPSNSIGEYAIAGCMYVTKQGIMRCIKTGKEDAKFLRLSPYVFGQHVKPYTEKYISKYNYYDTKTHEFLGNYLRLYRDLFDINLMPFYNCFSYRFFDDIYLTTDNSKGYELSSNSNYKVAAIPIKFDRKYTIALDSSTSILLKACFHDSIGNMVIKLEDDSEFISTELLKDCEVSISNSSNSYTTINDGVVIIPQMNFGDPIKFEIKLDCDNLTDSYRRKLKALEKYLYLVIQIPINNSSSIVVLEGDYNNIDYNTNYYNIEKNYYIYDYSEDENNPSREYINKDKLIDNILSNNTNYIKSNISNNTTSGDALNIVVSLIEESTEEKKNNFLLTDLSLLEINTEEIYAFSNRLVEYLLLNVVDSEDTIDNNTIKLQNIFELFNRKDTAPSVFSDRLRYLIYKKYLLSDNIKIDINGFVDKDVEKMILKMDGDF